MPIDIATTFIPEVQMATSCMDCLREKAGDGDVEATKIIKLLKYLSEHMACHFLTKTNSDPCSDRVTKPIPGGVKSIVDAPNFLATGGSLDLLLGGFVHRVIEDEDWDTLN